MAGARRRRLHLGDDLADDLPAQVQDLAVDGRVAVDDLPEDDGADGAGEDAPLQRIRETDVRASDCDQGHGVRHPGGERLVAVGADGVREVEQAEMELAVLGAVA